MLNPSLATLGAFEIFIPPAPLSYVFAPGQTYLRFKFIHIALVMVVVIMTLLIVVTIVMVVTVVTLVVMIVMIVKLIWLMYFIRSY